MKFSTCLKNNVQWPILSEDGKVPTAEFLERGNTIVSFLDCMGRLYIPVKSDVEGNIIKLRKRYSQDPVKYNFLHDMIIEEKIKEENFAIDALLWLKRGLHFIYLFLKSLVEDHKAKVTTESLLSNSHTAYESSLKCHHNFALRSLYALLSQACPRRSVLLSTMANEDKPAEEFMTQLEVFTDGLRLNLKSIFDLYNAAGLDNCQLMV